MGKLMDDRSQHKLRFFWKNFFLAPVGNPARGVKMSDIYSSCGGEQRGGLLFYRQGEGITILKCIGNKCYEKVGDIGDDRLDWELIGELIEFDNPPGDLRPYT